MFRKILASLVLATFLVAQAPAPAQAGRRSGGGAGGEAIVGAVVMIVLTVATLGLIHLFAKKEEEETYRQEANLNAALAQRALGNGTVTVTSGAHGATATVTGTADVLLPAEPGDEPAPDEERFEEEDLQ